MDNQEWTIERKPKGQSRMNYREKTKGTIKNEQSRYTGNIRYTRQGLRQAKKKKKKKNAIQKTKFSENTDPTKNWG